MSDLGFAIFLLTHQKEGTSFCAPKIGYRSQKQPILAILALIIYIFAQNYYVALVYLFAQLQSFRIYGRKVLKTKHIWLPPSLTTTESQK